MIDSALLPYVERELARRSLLDYAKRVYRGFEAPQHIEHIAKLLQDVAAGKLRRLIINVPARHGKSTLSSMCFPAWFLGQHPEKNIICASHSEDLAVRNSRIAKALFEDDRSPFDVKISKDSSSAQRWNTSAGGGLFAIGTGGGITGRGGDIILIDDPLHDGLSQSECEKAWSWFREILAPRLEPAGAIVLLGTRFREDDLFGRALAAEDGDSWTVVRFPAIAEEHDVLGRAPGEALWPERMPLEELEMRRVSMGSFAFESQFQQHPSPPDGASIKREWFERRFTLAPTVTVPTLQARRRSLFEFFATTQAVTRPVMKIQAIDTASKTGVANDWSVIATIVFDDVDAYLVDIERRRVTFTDLVDMVIAEYREHAPDVIYIEDSSAGTAVIQQLRASTALPIIPVTPRGSKESRVAAITPWFEAKRVLLPEKALWLDGFLDEACAFPFYRHDDQIDAVTLGLSMIYGSIERRERVELNASVVHSMMDR